MDNIKGETMKNKAKKDKTLKLGIFERLSLPQVLPDKASLEKAIICGDIRDKIKIKQADIQRVKLQTLPNGSMQWDETKDKKIIVAFTDLELEVIISGFKKMGEEEKFPTDFNFIKMYRMFNELS